jgi:hypothetical protein
MKTFQITYSGVNSHLKLALRNNPQEVEANTAREAVEQYYSTFRNESYWPDHQGNIFDADGHLVCGSNDDEIHFDGGYIRAEIQKP